jgi:hypothetical protein
VLRSGYTDVMIGGSAFDMLSLPNPVFGRRSDAQYFFQMDSNSTVVDAETTPIEPVKQRISLSPTTIPSRRSASHLSLGRPSARTFNATVAKVEPRKTFV